MKEIIDWISNNTEFINLIIAMITMMIIIWYAVSTKIIASKTAESVRSTNKHIEMVSNLERDKLTYKLIKEWFEDKKFLTLKRKRIGETFLSTDSTQFSLEKCFIFIENYNNFLDYFSLVNNLVNNKRINEELYFMILSNDIINFYGVQFDDNKTVIDGLERNIDRFGHNMPKISSRDDLMKIFELAKNYVNNTEEN